MLARLVLRCGGDRLGVFWGSLRRLRRVASGSGAILLVVRRLGCRSGCGGGPQDRHLAVLWRVGLDGPWWASGSRGVAQCDDPLFRGGSRRGRAAWRDGGEVRRW